MDLFLIWKHKAMLLKGTMVTLELTGGAITMGLILGIIAGMGVISRNKWYRTLSDIYVQLIRGTPVLLQDVARVELGPDERRGLTELNGEGEVASDIVLQRFGSNALDVINSVKARIAEMAASLPQGVSLLPVYDRSALIHAAIETLKSTLLEESVVVALVCSAGLAVILSRSVDWVRDRIVKAVEMEERYVEEEARGRASTTRANNQAICD